MKEHKTFLEKTIQLAKESIENGGGPFAAVIVKNGKIIATGTNAVTKTNDPTAHAEVVAIRTACESLNTFELTDCIIYSSCEPCPMCLGAIFWSRPKAVYFALTKEDAAKAGFDDKFIYEEISKKTEERKIPFIKTDIKDSEFVFQDWLNSSTKKEY
jgi:guanine deaminase